MRRGVVLKKVCMTLVLPIEWWKDRFKNFVHVSVCIDVTLDNTQLTFSVPADGTPYVNRSFISLVFDAVWS